MCPAERAIVCMIHRCIGENDSGFGHYSLTVLFVLKVDTVGSYYGDSLLMYLKRSSRELCLPNLSLRGSYFSFFQCPGRTWDSLLIC